MHVTCHMMYLNEYGTAHLNKDNFNNENIDNRLRFTDGTNISIAANDTVIDDVTYSHIIRDGDKEQALFQWIDDL